MLLYRRLKPSDVKQKLSKSFADVRKTLIGSAS